MLPHSIIVQAGHWLPSPGREIAGDVELLTHKGVDEIKTFYLRELRAVGFDTSDIGYGTLNGPAAAYLGVANILQGYRSDTGLNISVTTRTASGFILPSRTVQIHWQKCDTSLNRGTATTASGLLNC